LQERNREYKADALRDFSIFFGALFFTCVVGIIELLPEFGNVNGIFGKVSISTIYFGLLCGIVFSIDKCFWLYEQNRTIGGYGFNFPTIEPYNTKGKRIKKLFIMAILLTFVVLYFVKIGVIL
jgi:hypothetical protein